MCPNYIELKDRFGVCIGAWCQLLDDLQYQLANHPEPEQTEEPNWDEEIPY